MKLHASAPRIIPINLYDASLVCYFPLWYPAQDMTGSATVKSYDKNRLTGTLTGTVWNYAGEPGRWFDEVDDTMTVTFTTPAAFSFIFWGKITGTTSGVDFQDCAFYIPNNCLRIQRYGVATRPSLTTYNGVGWDTYNYGMTAAAQQEWHCYGGSVTNGEQKIYLDGAYVAGGTANWAVQNNLIFAGESFHPARYTGEFIAYSRMLSASDHANIYDATKWRYS